MYWSHLLRIRIHRLNIDRSRIVLRNILEITTSLINNSGRLNWLRCIDICRIRRINKGSSHPIARSNFHSRSRNSGSNYQLNDRQTTTRNITDIIHCGHQLPKDTQKCLSTSISELKNHRKSIGLTPTRLRYHIERKVVTTKNRLIKLLISN